MPITRSLNVRDYLNMNNIFKIPLTKGFGNKLILKATVY